MSKYDFPKRHKKTIAQRDGFACIYCGSIYTLQYAHFIPRSKGGLGIPENGVLLCQEHHHALDNGHDSDLAKRIHEHIEWYLTRAYGRIDKQKIIDKYDKVYPRKG